MLTGQDADLDADRQLVIGAAGVYVLTGLGANLLHLTTDDLPSSGVHSAHMKIASYCALVDITSGTATLDTVCGTARVDIISTSALVLAA